MAKWYTKGVKTVSKGGKTLKRLYLLLATSLLLIACSTQTKSSSTPEKKDVEVSVQEVYRQLVDDYEKAAKTAISEVDNPLLNASSLAAARRYTGEGDLDIVSKTVDLNQDGRDELLIGTKTPSGEKEVTIYTATYGLVNGKVVDLLAEILETNMDAYLVFYTNNRLRLDFVTEDSAMGTAVYELTDQGFKELIRIETDLSSELDDSGNYASKDGEGNRYQADQAEAKMIAVLGHAWDEDVID